MIAIYHGHMDEETQSEFFKRLGVSAIHSGLIIDVSKITDLSFTKISVLNHADGTNANLDLVNLFTKRHGATYIKAILPSNTKVELLGNILRYPVCTYHLDPVLTPSICSWRMKKIIMVVDLAC